MISFSFYIAVSAAAVVIAAILTAIITSIVAGSKNAADILYLRKENERLQGLSREREVLLQENASLRKEHETDAQKIQWKEADEQRSREMFQSLASQVLQANASQFMNQSKEQIELFLKQMQGGLTLHRSEITNIIQPLSKGIGELDKQVRELEQKREGAYQGMSEQLVGLSRAQHELQVAASSLTSALRSSGAARGKWGEMQLRRLVEMAGLQEHVDFEEQTTGDDGGRPDMIIRMPQEGIVPVDAKAPMEAFLDAVGKDDAYAKGKIAEHARALRSHVQQLSKKSYWEQFKVAPRFVIMLIPYDAGLHAAFEADGTLYDYALENHVIIASPATLLALLKVISYGWLQLTLSKNAEEISRHGRELFDRVALFIKHFASVGENLDKAVEFYNKAVGSYETRVLPAGKRMKELDAGTGELAAVEKIDTRPRAVTAGDEK
ncbi:MAG: DNA recombination protein RmuC [Spirochaetes bacterium]|nr:DNA recombination protein RmuC [Spirochaetota bacterium]